MYLPSLVMVGLYFDKRRALASGIAMCGSGIGTFVFAPLSQSLINQYSWKGATWIIAGICLNGAVCGAFLRPLKKISLHAPNTTNNESHHVNEGFQGDLTLEISKDMLDQASGEPACSSMGFTNDLHVTQNVSQQSRIQSACRPDILKTNDDVEKHTQKCQRYDEGYPHHKPDTQHQRWSNISDQPNDDISTITSDPPLQQSGDNASCRTLRNMCKSLRHTLSDDMDISLFKNPVFCIYGLSCFLCMIGKLRIY